MIAHTTLLGPALRQALLPPIFRSSLGALCAALALGTGLGCGSVSARQRHAEHAPPNVRPVPMATASATGLPAAVLQALNQAQVPPQALGVMVVPVTSPNLPLLLWQADTAVNPASVMKLFTTYAGLSLLGPDYRWRTRVLAEGPLEAGTLQGPLYVQGGGDPHLVLEDVQALLGRLRQLGIERVAGDLVLDRGVFELPNRTEAFDDEPLRPYNVAPDGLLLNFHSVIYRFEPDAATGRARLSTEPPLAGLQLQNDVPLQSGPCQDWRGQLKADFSVASAPRFAGRYPEACGTLEWPVAFADPASYAGRMWQALWQQTGGQWQGTVRSDRTPASARLLAEQMSQPLSEQIAYINKFSNNVMAQQLLLTLSSAMGAPGRFEASRRRVQRWWQDEMPGIEAPVLDNGSGLSRQERSSPRSLMALLLKARQGPLAEPFTASLSVAGVDGTASRMRERLPGSPLLGKAWLKTGSLRDVASVAGYVQDASGQLHAVVAIIHHDKAPRARAALDALLEWVACTPTGPAARRQ